MGRPPRQECTATDPGPEGGEFVAVVTSGIVTAIAAPQPVRGRHAGPVRANATGRSTSTSRVSRFNCPSRPNWRMRLAERPQGHGRPVRLEEWDHAVVQDERVGTRRHPAGKSPG